MHYDQPLTCTSPTINKRRTLQLLCCHQQHTPCLCSHLWCEWQQLHEVEADRGPTAATTAQQLLAEGGQEG